MKIGFVFNRVIVFLLILIIFVNLIPYTAFTTYAEEKNDDTQIAYEAEEGETASQENDRITMNEDSTEIDGSKTQAYEDNSFVNVTDKNDNMINDSEGFVSKDAEESATYIANNETSETSADTNGVVEITYAASNGGTVSQEREMIDLSDDTNDIKGATAQEDNGYSFVNWTDASGKVVSDSKTFIPKDVSENTSYTANFESTMTTSTAESESKMPKNSFTKNASNGITVVATVDEGVFPVGTTMQVTSVSTDEVIQAAQSAVSGEIIDAEAANITFYDADGNEIQPADNTQVHVTLTSRNKVEGSKYSVIHIGDDGAKKIADASATTASFDTGSFSIYAIIGQPDGKATITYEFYNDALIPVLLSTSLVKDGDTLVAPGTPVSSVDASATFLGWSPEDKPTEYQTFGTVTIPSTVQSDTTVKLYARFHKTYHVFFHNQFGAIIQSFSVENGDNFHIADYNSYVTFPIPVDQALISWSTILASSGTETGLGGKGGAITDLIIAKDVDLYPVLESAYWITFVSNGGSYTAPEFFKISSSTEAPAEPTWAGYTFEGWYTDETLTQQYTFGSPLSAGITLYAKWKTNEVIYTIFYWVEALDSNANYAAGNYEYKASKTLQAVTGSQVTINADNVGQSYPYYTFDHGDQNVTIDGDGQTVVNAYFHMNTYTLSFNLDDTSSGSSTRTSTLTIGGNTYSASSPYSFTAHFGENIGGRWPTAGNLSTAVTGTDIASQFSGWLSPSGKTIFVTKRLTVTSDLLSSTDNNTTSTYPAQYEFSLKPFYINYWLENANDTGYTLSAEYSQEALAKANTNWSAKMISGFTNIPTTPDGYPATDKTVNTYNFYYTRNTNSLEFSNYGTIEKTIDTIKYGSDISGYNYMPERPSTLSSDYQFRGWYTNSNCLDGTEFEFVSAVMPYRNLVVFAKWALPDYTVHFDLNGGTSLKISDQTDVFGQQLSYPDPPSRVGYAFSGWTLGGKAFDFDSIIAGNILTYAVNKIITLQAHWIGGLILQIRYNAGEGANAPIDSSAYCSSTNAVVAKASTPPEGKYFLYWTLNGMKYYPGDTIMLDTVKATDGVITLTAVYGEVQLVSITYHPNGGNGIDYTTDLMENNTKITTLACNDSKINYCRDGYIFTAWNTKADGSGTSYAEDTIAYIDNIGGNNLYAQWAVVGQASNTAEFAPHTVILPFNTVIQGPNTVGQIPNIVAYIPKTGDNNDWMISLIVLFIGIIGLCVFTLILCRGNLVFVRIRTRCSRKVCDYLSIKKNKTE